MTTPYTTADLYVASDDVDAVGVTLNTVLAKIVETFELAGVELPERRYIWWGATAHDCDQVTVSVLQLYLGTPGDPAAAPQRCDAPRTLVLSCQIVRKVPLGQGGRVPYPSALSSSSYAEERARDAWILLEAGLKACDEWGVGAIADVNPTDPSGEYQAVALNLTLPVV